MKSLPYILFILLLIVAVSCDLSDEATVIDDKILALADFDYFESDIPFNQTKYDFAAFQDEEAALGRLLFYDSRLSLNNSISCASCHKQQNGFADNKVFSVGIRGFETTRNSMALANNAYQISHFWEGNTGEIEDHVLNPISNHIEMGMRSIDDLVVRLSEIEDYNKLFDDVYKKPISEELIKSSIGTFVASIISYNSKFDKGKLVDFSNFTLSEFGGKDLFFGKAKCGQCHKGDHFSASWRRNTNIGLDMNYEDEGAGSGHFKVPTLRNVGLTAPYMHDGRFETLEEVVEHYTEGVKDHPSLDWTLTRKIHLTDDEKIMLIDFLNTLTDYELISDSKFSNPFN